MEIALMYAVFVAAAIGFGVTIGLRMKGSTATRVIAGCIATFAAFVFFYKLVLPIVGAVRG